MHLSHLFFCRSKGISKVKLSALIISPQGCTFPPFAAHNGATNPSISLSSYLKSFSFSEPQDHENPIPNQAQPRKHSHTSSRSRSESSRRSNKRCTDNRLHDYRFFNVTDSGGINTKERERSKRARVAGKHTKTGAQCTSRRDVTIVEGKGYAFSNYRSRQYVSTFDQWCLTVRMMFILIGYKLFQGNLQLNTKTDATTTQL